MSTYRDKFLEAEKKATQLVEHLTKLKEDTSHYRNAGESLTRTHKQVSDLISEVESVIKEQREMISALKEISTQELIDAIESCQESLNVKLSIIQEHNDANITHGKRIQNLLYLSLVFIVIVGILVVAIK
jgi:seryl-tRNA synthetase